MHRGFTLIELMIVISIIAVLAAILIPNFLHARAESQTAACEANERQIAVALEEYAVDTGGIYPPTQAVAPGMFGGAGNVYMNGTPLDPLNGTTYNYTITAPDCTNPGVKYEILDNGGHDPTVKVANAAIGARTVLYCSGAGLNGK
jgi:prepilin-type N-terminal cleavage/methylation domain-containing protein